MFDASLEVAWGVGAGDEGWSVGEREASWNALSGAGSRKLPARDVAPRSAPSARYWAGTCDAFKSF
jgi:hypothetical protein